MKSISIVIIASVTLILVSIVLFSVYYLMNAKAQSDLVTDLTDRLLKEGVPLKGINETSLENLAPNCLSITIQRIADEKDWSSEDLWFDQITRREATLSYRYGYNLKCFSLRTLNNEGSEISKTISFLNPTDPSQNPYPFTSEILDDELVEKLVLESIKTYG